MRTNAIPNTDGGQYAWRCTDVEVVGPSASQQQQQQQQQQRRPGMQQQGPRPSLIRPQVGGSLLMLVIAEPRWRDWLRRGWLCFRHDHMLQFRGLSQGCMCHSGCQSRKPDHDVPRCTLQTLRPKPSMTSIIVGSRARRCGPPCSSRWRPMPPESRRRLLGRRRRSRLTWSGRDPSTLRPRRPPSTPQRWHWRRRRRP